MDRTHSPRSTARPGHDGRLPRSRRGIEFVFSVKVITRGGKGHEFEPRLPLQTSVVVGDLIVGTWKRTVTRDGVHVALTLHRRLSGAQRRRLDAHAARMAAFAGTSVKMTLTGRPARER